VVRGFVVLLLLSLVTVFFGFDYGVAGGGCICVFAMSATVTWWMYRTPEPAIDVKTKISRIMADLWDLLVMPFLFSIMGSGISISALFEWDFFWRAMVCIVIGAVVRGIVTFCCTYGFPLEMRERILMCFIFPAKATAQVALGSLALTKLPPNPSPDQVLFATRVNQCAVLSVIFFAPLAAVSAVRVGPAIMKKDVEFEEEEAAAVAATATATVAATLAQQQALDQQTAGGPP